MRVRYFLDTRNNWAKVTGVEGSKNLWSVVFRRYFYGKNAKKKAEAYIDKDLWNKRPDLDVTLKKAFNEYPHRNCINCIHGRNIKYHLPGYPFAQKCALGHKTFSSVYYYWLCKFYERNKKVKK